MGLSMTFVKRLRGLIVTASLVFSIVVSVKGRGEDLGVVRRGDSVVLRSLADLDLEGQVLTLQRSSDLESWAELGRFRSRLEPYALGFLPDSQDAFFRLITRRLLSSDDWANQLLLPRDSLIARADGSGGLGAAPFVKFTIELQESERVFFQDSSKYPFHFTFIRERLAGYENLDFNTFEALALRAEGQALVLGSVILAPDPSIAELAIQFSGQEPFDVGDVVQWFHTVAGRLSVRGDSWRFFYMPTFEQRDVTFANETVFREQGVVVDTPARWTSEPVCYAEGWALGRLVFVPAAEIDAAYGDGRLQSRDVLVTETVPAEIPIVAGVISLQPTTPNSHVAILARSFNVPFVFASGTGLQAQIDEWNGDEVLLTVSNTEEGCTLGIQNVNGLLSDEEREQILATKAPPTIEIHAKREAGQLWFSTDELGREHVGLVGGKAANFGVLRRSIPENSPESLAFSFDLWDAFMNQSEVTELTLQEWIQEQLSSHRGFPIDIASLRGTLASIRDRIKNRAHFDPATQALIIEALRGFEPGAKIRFRSSTNVEDSEQFVGAGLYDSFSGCLRDDLDADLTGPSHCDSSKSKERGVFRAIRKVYASFYNENAYLERLRHGIDEDRVAMGVLVHHSFPDERELANGVATLEIRKHPGAEDSISATLVTQWGADSVTNPDTEFLPEVVLVSGGAMVVESRSSLVPLDETVLNWNDEYRALMELLLRAAQEYESTFQTKSRLLLDFEYKKMAAIGLVVKQIRAIPQPPQVPPPTIESRVTKF